MPEKNRQRLRERAVIALLSSPSLEKAARKIGVCSKTLSRWLQEPEFRDAYEAKKKDYLRAGVGNLITKTFLAAETLGQIAKSRGRPHQGPRSHAAAAILKLALDAAMIEDHELRLAALERQGRNNEKIRVA